MAVARAAGGGRRSRSLRRCCRHPRPGVVSRLHTQMNNAVVRWVGEGQQAPWLLVQHSWALRTGGRMRPGSVTARGVQGPSGAAWLCRNGAKLGWTQLQIKYFLYRSCFVADRQNRGRWAMYRRQSVLYLPHPALKTCLLDTGGVEVPCLLGHSLS